MSAPVRGWFEHDGLRLSYLDHGGDGPVLLALHGHLNEGAFVDQGGVPPGTGYRVVAPDQRGHGESEHASSYGPEEYVGDALALLDHLGLDRVSVLGHSLGGLVANLLAARAPDRVHAVVVVDIAAVIDDRLDLVTTFPRRAQSREALVEAFSFLGANQAYVMREHADGWGVPWDAEEMVASQHAINGDHWADWLASTAPLLLVHGTQSRNLSTAHAEDMAARRPGTELVHLDAGHAVYRGAPEEYAATVSDFLHRHRP